MRRRYWILATLIPVVAAGVYVSVEVVPRALLRRANDASYACLERVWKGLRDDAWACAAEAEKRLAYPLAVPGTEAKAREQLAEVRCRAASMDLVVAARSPNADRRAKASARRAEMTCPGAGPEDIAEMFAAGAFHEVLRWSGQRRNADRFDVTAGAAMALADLDALRRIAAVDPGPERGSYDSVALSRGAMLCLFGEPEAGLRALERAKNTPEAAILRLSCGAAPEEAAKPGDGERRGDLKLAEELTNPATRPAALGQLEKRLRMPEDRRRDYPLVVLSLVDREASAEELLTAFFPRFLRVDRGSYSPDPDRFLSPWSLLSTDLGFEAKRTGEGYAMLAASARIAALAAVVEQAAAKAPPRLPPADEEGTKVIPTAAAAAEPAKHLRRAAWAMWLEAGAWEALRGDWRKVKEAAEHADALAPSPVSAMTASLFLASGEAERALAVTERARAHPSFKDASVMEKAAIHFQRALALAHLRRFADAFEASVEARDVLARAPAPKGPRKVMDAPTSGEVLSAATLWLRAALAMRSGHGTEPFEDIPLAPPARPHVSKAGGLVALEWEAPEIAWWQHVALSPERDRSKMRDPSELDLIRAQSLALPAVLDLASLSVPEEDIEAWLDVLLHWAHRRQARFVAWARAEAALWRGDQAARALWMERGARLSTLVKDHRSEWLARAAGL